MMNTPRENNSQNRSHTTGGAFGGALLGIFGGVLADMLIGPLFGLVGGANGVLGAFSRIVGGMVSGAIAGRRQRAIVSGIIVAFIVALIVRQFGEMIGEAAIGGVMGRIIVWALIGVVVGAIIGLIIREVRVIGYRTKKRFDDIDDPIIIDGKPPQIMNRTPEDIFEKLWVAACFAPLAVFYTAMLLTLRSIFEYLNTIEILKEVNEFWFGYGTSMLILYLMKIAAKNSHNDFIAGPVEQLNLYTAFFLGLVKGNLLMAIIFMIVYLARELVGVLRNELIKYKSLGYSRKSIVLYHGLFAPLATITSAAIAYLILDYFLPVDKWISRGIVYQIQFMTFQVVLWTVVYKVIAIRIEGIGVRGDFLISRLFGLLIPPLFLPDHIWAWILYLIGIAWAWLDIGLHIWSGNAKAKRSSK